MRRGEPPVDLPHHRLAQPDQPAPGVELGGGSCNGVRRHLDDEVVERPAGVVAGELVNTRSRPGPD
jgi:hypothetical protein